MTAPLVLASMGQTARTLAKLAHEADLPVYGFAADVTAFALDDAVPAELHPLARADDVPDESIVVTDVVDLSTVSAARRIAELSAMLPAHAIVVACTATSPVAELAGRSATASRVVGLHLSRAIVPSQLAEIVPGVATSHAAVDRLAGWLRGVGLEAVVAPDRPGFLVDALLRPYLNQVVHALEDRVAAADDIDNAVKLGLGHPEGPLALLDRLGLDEHLAVTQALYDATGDTHFAPPALVRGMVAAGWTGRGAERGFTIGTETDHG